MDGGHHCEVVFDWNSYRIPCRNMYCMHSAAKNNFTFQTIKRRKSRQRKRRQDRGGEERGGKERGDVSKMNTKNRKKR